MDEALGALTEWVAAQLGVPADYGEFPGPAPCAMVKASPGDPWVYRYRSGGGMRRLPYEVYLKVPAVTGEQRLGGMGALKGLADAIAGGAGPEVGARVDAHEVRGLPSLYAEDAGAGSVYQLLGELRYVIRS